MEVVRLLEKCGLPPCMASQVLLYSRHPLLAALGGELGRRRESRCRRWCSVCGEHSAGQPLFRCIKTLRPLCETCLLEERCFDCYH